MVLYGENFLGSNPEQLLEESRLCPGIALGYPLHSSFPNHVHRCDSFEGSPGALKGVVTLGQSGTFLYGPVVLLNHMIEELTLA
jgi:hypothetical protein